MADRNSKVKRQHDDRNKIYDVMFLCDDKDAENEDMFIPFERLETAHSLLFAYVYHGKEPGKDFFTNVYEINEKAKCVVFYITENYCNNTSLVHLTQRLAQCNNNLICVLPDENINIQDTFYFLTCTIIYQTVCDWQQKLAQTVKKTTAQYPPYCKCIVPKFLSDALIQMGLSVSTLKWDMLGVMVQMGEQILKVDLDTFVENLENHDRFHTYQVCASVAELCTLETSVVIVLDENSPVYNTPGFREKIAKLGSAVMNVVESYKNAENIWMLFCSFEGLPLYDRYILNYLSDNIHARLVNKCMDYLSGTCWHPEFANIQLRKESFIGNMPHIKSPSEEKIAEAGFFFSKHHNQTECFYCRLVVSVWKENDDPWLMHACASPNCSHVKSNMTTEQIESAKGYRKQNLDSHMYDTVENRINSFETFDIKNLKTSDKIDEEDRDSIIRLIAEAGFYFYGASDIIACSFCGLRLCAYDPSNKLSLLHAKLSPKCRFVLNMFGEQGVNLILETAQLEASDNLRKGKTEITFRIALDRRLRRDLPKNLFIPPFV